MHMLFLAAVAAASPDWPEETVPAVVASRIIEAGQTITADDVQIRPTPPDFLPDTTYTDVQELLGRVPKERILAAELIRQERLAPVESGIGPVALLPKGMRLVKLPAAAVGVGLEDYVDVLVAWKDGETTGVCTAAQALQILQLPDGAGAELLLGATPEQAQRVAWAKAAGTVSIAARNRIDVAQVDVRECPTQEAP